jgi:hypothetical protein
MNDQDKSNQENETPDVRVIMPEYSIRPWYRETWVLVLTFLFLTPVWLILVLTDSEISTKNKVLAVLLVLLIFWISSKMF